MGKHERKMMRQGVPPRFSVAEGGNKPSFSEMVICNALK